MRKVSTVEIDCFQLFIISAFKSQVNWSSKLNFSQLYQNKSKESQIELAFSTGC